MSNDVYLTDYGDHEGGAARPPQQLRFPEAHRSSQYDGREFARSGAKIGDTVGIRRPVQFTVRSGQSTCPGPGHD
jgi:hypothetical protein